MPQTMRPRSDFERKIALESPAHFALARRLVDDTLLKDERVKFELVHRILALQGEGRNMTQIAAELGQKLSNLSSFVNRGTFRTMSAFVRDRETSGDGKVQEARAKSERARFEALGAKALDFLERCFEKNDKGQFVSKMDARWATAIVAKGKGWDEKEDGRRALGEIKIGVIVAQQQAIRQSDAKLRNVGTLVIEAAGQTATIPLELDRDHEALDGDEGAEHDDFGFPELPSPVPSE